MKSLLKAINKSALAKTTGLALVAALAISFVGSSFAGQGIQLTVNVSDECGPVEAQVVIVNGPDDGAFGITTNGTFTFTDLNAGVFYLHITADGHVSHDTDPIVLTGNQTIDVSLARTSECGEPGTPPTSGDKHSLTVNIDDECGPVEAQVVIVNGPDDGAFGITTNGTFTFTELNVGVFYLHVSATDHVSFDSDPIVLDSSKTVEYSMQRTTDCPGTPPPPPPPSEKHNLTVNVNDECGPVVAQIVIVNGPDDGAFGITNANGTFVFNDLNPGVFYLHITADNHVSKDTDTIVLDSDKTVNVTLQRTTDCPGTPPPPTPAPDAFNIFGDCFGWPNPAFEVNFNPVDNANTFSLERRQGANDWSVIVSGLTYAQFDQFSDTSVQIDQTYEYRVIATGDGGSTVSNNTITAVINGDNCGFIPPPPPTDNPPTGSLDTANCEIIAGWAKDPDLTSPLQVKIYGDGTSTTGTLVTTITANQSRSDVGNHAFSIPTPSFFTDGNSHTINAYAVDQTNNNALILLAGSPKTIFCPIEPNDPHLTIAKTVRNVTDNHVSFVESVNATAGEQVEFQITVTSNGDATANNVVVTDVLPNNFSFNFASFGSDITQTSNLVFNLGNMPVNTSKTLKITATAASASNFPIGSSTWTNTANVTSSNANSASDTAQVVINRTQVTTVTIDIDKTARNISDNQTSFSNSVNAEPGDEIEFKIIVSASGNTSAQNVIMTDDLPNDLDLVSGSTSVNLGNIASGDTETVTLRARVADGSEFGCGTFTRANVAQATASNTSTVTDTADVIVTSNTNCGGGGGGSARLHIEKTVRNVTDSTSFGDSVNADINDIVEFRLVIENTGSRDADDVILKDNLPAGLIYIAGSFNADAGSSSGNLFGSGQELGDLDNGDERVITFRARVNASGTHINVATADSDNTGSDSDDARVIVGIVQGTFTAPPTGPAQDITIILALMSVAGFALFRNREKLKTLVQNLV